MDFRELKIGYVPYLPDLSQPGDRRRFPYFATKNQIPFEIADIRKCYDIILLTGSGNLSQWLSYRNKNTKTRFIFEMVDSLIFSSDTFSNLFKGIGRFILKKEDSLYFQHTKLIKKWLKAADVVLCSSTELKNMVEQWNSNVVVSLDYLQSEYKCLKTDYHITGKMKLIWEGQGAVLPHFLHFKEVFRRVSSFCELHIITSQKYPRFGKLIKLDVEKILTQLPIKTIFHEWDINNNGKVFSECDCGIIALNQNNPFGWHKPSNKLISFWFSGIPTIVSNTPAYTELMNSAGEVLYCGSEEEWVARIRQVKKMKPEKRAALAKRNLEFVCDNYSDEALDKIWHNIFSTISK